MKYFFDNGKDIGLKADIKRHNEEEKELISKYNSSLCLRLKNAYLNFLYQLYLKCISRTNWQEKQKRSIINTSTSKQ